MRQVFYCAAVYFFFLQTALEAQIPVQPRRRPLIESERILVVAADGSGQFYSIQEAIDAADFNTTVKIKKGVYRESILLRSFISLEGEGVGKTILISDRPQPIVTSYNMSGGKISNISFEFLPAQQTPVLVAKYSVFLIENCSFKNGSVGLQLSANSAITVNRCMIAGHSGNGIEIFRESFGKITECVIELNQKNGILIDGRSSPSLEHNTIRSNGGAGIVIKGQTLGKIVGNYIYSNQGGILILDGSEPMIRNNTLVSNNVAAAQKQNSRGFGIRLYNNGLVNLTNNIIAGHTVGIIRSGDGPVKLFRNNLWNNEVAYINVPDISADISADPLFRNAEQYDFRLDSLSPLSRKGEQGLNIGADYDTRLSSLRKRIEFLKNNAAQEIARGNWYNAYQSAQEIVTTDRNDAEGRRLFERAGKELAIYYTNRAREEYQNESIKAAEHFIRLALNYQNDYPEALDLKKEVESYSRNTQIRFFGILIGLILLFTGSLFYLKRRIQYNEIRRQAKWWLDDAEEHLLTVNTTESEKLAPDDLQQARIRMQEARQAFENRDFERCEHLANEVVRYASRVKDETTKYRRLQKDALYEVSRAEERLRALRDSEWFEQIRDRYDIWMSELERARESLLRKQYYVALERATGVQQQLQEYLETLQTEHREKASRLIAETESLIIQALTGNSSTDIIMAVIDFKAELEIIKNGFQSNILSPEEVNEQVGQIKQFIEEVLRIGGYEETSSAIKPPRSPYEILGIKEDATIEQIKAVYHKLSMIYHPDVSTSQNLGIAGDSRFKEIKEAYEFLMNERGALKKGTN